MIELVLISGMAGAGKSTALNILEDNDYLCVDNLPPPLLVDLVELYKSSSKKQKIAVGIDTRSRAMLKQLPKTIDELLQLGYNPKLVILDAKTDVLVTRFSETRRKHPFANGKKTIEDCIASERAELSILTTLAYHIDTSELSANDLRRIIKQFVEAKVAQMTIVLQSFGFKYGLPIDSDFVFDVRSLPNPHYNRQIQKFNGTEEPIREFLAKQPKVAMMINDIHTFLKNWLNDFGEDNRNFLNIAIGCTGGKHRSVYIVEALAKLVNDSSFTVIVRHRQLDLE